MTPDQHFRSLKHSHEVTIEMYLIQIACTFELNGNDLIQLYYDARAANYTKEVAREIVLADYHIIPYEEYLRCYVLSGTTKWRLRTSAVGSASAVASEDAPDASASKDGDVSTVKS